MVTLEDKALNDIIRAINHGLDYAYFYALKNKRIPSKEVIQEAKSDLDEILKQIEIEDKRASTQRIRKYKEIIDLLYNIPQEDFLRDENTTNFTKELRNFTFYYSDSFERIVGGDKLAMIPYKYSLIEAKSKLAQEREMGADTSYIEKLVDLADRYLELLKI